VCELVPFAAGCGWCAAVLMYCRRMNREALQGCIACSARLMSYSTGLICHQLQEQVVHSQRQALETDRLFSGKTRALA
jgi:hypothetical protein